MDRIGVDEAGRGPVLGPLVVAAVRTDDPARLREWGVRDSKQLSPKTRAELAIRIMRSCEFEVVSLPATEIDAQRRTASLNQIEVEMFARCLAPLLTRPAAILLDAADVVADRFGINVEKALGSSLGSSTIVARHKADEADPVVAAASIIAKDVRDQRLAEIERIWGAPIGSGYPSDPVTIAFVEAVLKGPEIPAFVRQSWKTVTRIRDRMTVTTLDQFE